MNNAEYTAIAGKIASTNKLRVITNNTANGSTPGFKADNVLFQQWLHSDFEKKNIMPVDAKTVVNYTQGNLQQTNNKLDLALIGKGFFAVTEPNGQLKFTRNGKLTINAEGILQDMYGRNVVDADGGEINIGQEYANLSILKDGRIIIDNDEIGSVGVFDFAENEIVKKAGYTNFVIEGEPQPGNPTEFSVMQGMLEASNVDPILGLLELTEINRQVDNNNLILNANRENIRSTYKIFSKSID